jgi:hypothetical protein
MKKSQKLLFITIVLSAIAMLLSVSFQVQPVKVTGTWNMVVETGQGSGAPVLILKQENDSIITGTYSGQLVEAALKGKIKVNNISLKFTASEIVVEYIGTVDGNNMKGKVIFGSYGEGTFTGKKKEN